MVRFIEERYRGEPQTKNILGLPIYQWLSVLSVLAGMALVLISSAPAPAPTLEAWPISVITGLISFALCWFAYGMDFPNSTIRFSRLSG